MKLSVIVPVYNERENIPPFYERTRKVLEAIPALESWQIVFVNDGSQDNSLERILKIRAQDPRVKVVTLSRNFGYHAVLVAGLTLTESDLYAIIDVDGEDPPELFTSFYQAIQAHAQVVYGIRSQRDEPRWITSFRALFYHINNRIADSPTVLWMAEFGMITKEVRNAILAPRTTYPFLRAELAYVGFRRVGIPYQRSKRMHGESHYRFGSMTRFAVAAFLASSTFPLRMVLYLAAGFGLALPIVTWLRKLSMGQAAAAAGLFMYYFLLLTVPMIALYLARTYKNGVARPVFIVDEGQTHLS